MSGTLRMSLGVPSATFKCFARAVIVSRPIGKRRKEMIERGACLRGEGGNNCKKKAK